MKLWDIKNSKVLNVHKKIMNMIAYSNYEQVNQPFSIVDDHGFIELLAEFKFYIHNSNIKYFNKTML